MRSNHRCHSKLVRARSTPTFSLMHLLVPGAYRRLWRGASRRSGRSQCTFWCRVLTDSGGPMRSARPGSRSQCTFWCRVLTDPLTAATKNVPSVSLNAPSGAGCLPTRDSPTRRLDRIVSMHLLVPGAYRHREQLWRDSQPHQSQCTFWCRVLTPPTTPQAPSPSRLNAPSDAGCLSTHAGRALAGPEAVSIHRVVLGAYRPEGRPGHRPDRPPRVSIHRVVLGAYRHAGTGHRQVWEAQVSIHRVVLGAYRRLGRAGPRLSTVNKSQYTVWCWVLIDVRGRAGRRRRRSRLNTPCGAGCLST